MVLEAGAGLVLDRHLLEAITITGIVLDVLGALYLAYDLLGGVHGSLRLLTSIVTYTFVFMVGYGLPFGLVFGLVVGAGFGLALGLEYRYLQQEQGEVTAAFHRFHLLFAPFRGIVLGIAAALTFSWVFGLIFGVLAGGGFTVLSACGFSPRGAYRAERKIHLRRPVLIASVLLCRSARARIRAGRRTGQCGRQFLQPNGDVVGRSPACSSPGRLRYHAVAAWLRSPVASVLGHDFECPTEVRDLTGRRRRQRTRRP